MSTIPHQPHDVPKSSGARSDTRRLYDFTGLHEDQNMSEDKVCAYLDLSRSTIRNKNDEGGSYFDRTFPRPSSMRGEAKKGTAVRYRAGDVMKWNRKCHGLSEAELPAISIED